MYGTRDAALNWECEYTEFTVACGFVAGIPTPCVFYHAEKDLRVVIHGGDVTLGGWEGDLDWFTEQISNKFEVKFRGRLGERGNKV